MLTAIGSGAAPTDLAELLLTSETDRAFADTGHSFDFINKAFECLDLIGWEYAPAGFRWCLHPQDAKKKHTAGVKGESKAGSARPLATPVAPTKGAQRGPTPPRPCPPSPVFLQRGRRHRRERRCALWPPWGVADGIEPAPARAHLVTKASWTAPKVPRLPPSCLRIAPRTYSDLPPPSGRGFSYADLEFETTAWLGI